MWVPTRAAQIRPPPPPPPPPGGGDSGATWYSRPSCVEEKKTERAESSGRSAEWRPAPVLTTGESEGEQRRCQGVICSGIPQEGQSTS